MHIKILEYYKKYDPLTYHQLIIQEIKNTSVILPELTEKEIEGYKSILQNYTIEGDMKRIEQKFKNIRDAIIIIHKKRPEDSKITTIIEWLKNYEYVIEQIETEDKESWKLKRTIQELSTQIKTFNNLYEHIIRDYYAGNYTDFEET